MKTNQLYKLAGRWGNTYSSWILQVELSCCHLFEATRISRKTEKTHKLNGICSSTMLAQISLHLQQQCNGIISLHKKGSCSHKANNYVVLERFYPKFNAICIFLFIHLSIKKFVFHKQMGMFLKLLIKCTITTTEYKGSKIGKTWKYFRMIKTRSQSVADIQENNFEQYLLFSY